MDNRAYAVVIACRNYGRFLSDAITSALEQTVKPARVIVVDDGSTDETPAIASRFSQRVDYLRTSGLGQAAAWNAAFAISDCDWTCFLDADDWWFADKMEACLKEAQRSGASLIMHDLEIDPIGERLVPWTGTHIVTGNARDYLLSHGLPWIFVPTSGFIAKTSLLRGVFPLNEPRWRMCADTPVLYACALQAPIAYVDRPLGAYRLHNANSYLRRGRYDTIDAHIVVENLWLMQRIAHEVTAVLTATGSADTFDLRKNYYYTKMMPWVRGWGHWQDWNRLLVMQACHHRLNIRPWGRELRRIARMWLSVEGRLQQTAAAVLAARPDQPLDLENLWQPVLK